MGKNVVIVGGGLVGSLLSIYLVRRKYSVDVFERRTDMRKEKMSAGRSINLALSDRGLLALERLELADSIREISIPMHGRFIHQIDSSTVFQPYGKEGQYINSVSRAGLNKKLIELAEKEGVRFRFDSRFAGVDWAKKELRFEDLSVRGDTHQSIAREDKHQVPIHYDLLFGTDGAFSITRLRHQLQHERFEYSQHYIDYGYKELSIPAGPGNEFQMDKNALHIWPRKEYMLIALPNLDGSFTCTFFLPFEGKPSFESLNTREKVISFFDEIFPDVAQLIPDLTDQFFNNKVSGMVTVKCYPWIRSDHFALVGDAAHAIVPFFGQGMNCGFEDCRILDELIGQHGDDWNAILSNYQQLRKPDADAIADMAAENFIEMRERTTDPKFLLQKKIEARIHEKYPGQWIPAYSQVTFNPQIRYSEALKRGQMQEKIMRLIMAMPGIENNWAGEEVEKRILEELETAKELTSRP